jgi:hypothetical protein
MRCSHGSRLDGTRRRSCHTHARCPAKRCVVVTSANALDRRGICAGHAGCALVPEGSTNQKTIGSRRRAVIWVTNWDQVAAEAAFASAFIALMAFVAAAVAVAVTLNINSAQQHTLELQRRQFEGNHSGPQPAFSWCVGA